jgi:hypothetical protein
MTAVTIQVATNGYVVAEANLSADGKVVENTGPAVKHVFANIDDLKYWLNAKLDVPVGEG